MTGDWWTYSNDIMSNIMSYRAIIIIVHLGYLRQESEVAVWGGAAG